MIRYPVFVLSFLIILMIQLDECNFFVHRESEHIPILILNLHINSSVIYLIPGYVFIYCFISFWTLLPAFKKYIPGIYFDISSSVTPCLAGWQYSN